MQFIGDNINRFKSGDVVIVGSNIPHYWKFDDVYFEEDAKAHANSIVAHFTDKFRVKNFFPYPEKIT